MANPFDIDTQNDFVNEVLQEWAIATEDALQAAINKRKKHVPEETIQNIRFRIIKATKGTVAKAILSFQDSGRHVDMRLIEHKKRPVQAGNHFILEWAKKRGRSKFRGGVPGYKDKRPEKLSEEQQLLRISNAIVVAMKEGKTKRRRRGKWFNRTFYKWVNKLVEGLVQAQVAYLNGQLKQQLEEIFNEK